MEEIHQKVRQARRRVLMNHFLWVVAWTLFATTVLVAIGVAIPKIWHLRWLSDPDAIAFWMAAWIIGGTVLGMMLAGLLTFLRRRSLLSVAVDVDQRFGLKSRLASALSMADDDQATSAGAALVRDASQQAELLEIGDQFRIVPPWQMVMPLIAAVVVGLLMLLPDAENASAKDADADQLKQKEREKIVTAVEELKKKIREKQTTGGLKDARFDFDPIEEAVADAKKDSPNAKKEALVKLNNLRKQIDQQQKNLGSTRDVQQSLNRLKDVGEGPARAVADALRKGDLNKAKQAVEDLAKKLRDGDLNDQEKKKLQQDLAAMAKQLDDMAKEHQQRKENLKKQIEDAKAAGDLDKAARLQEKLEELERQEARAEQMKKMAENLKQAKNAMEQAAREAGEGGDKAAAKEAMEDAAKQMDDLAKQMQQIQQDMEQMEDLEDLQDAIEQAKGQINGDADGNPADGDGGEGKGEGQQGDGPPGQGQGDGEGEGGGIRDREENNTGNFKSRVKTDPQKGKVVITGNADGENISGRTTSEAREMIQAEMNSQKDPLENQVLPRSQREHAREYFESLRGGP